MIPGVVTGAQIAAALQGRFTKGGVVWCNGCDCVICMLAWLFMAGNNCRCRSYWCCCYSGGHFLTDDDFMCNTMLM
jgi:hypothetical protein